VTNDHDDPAIARAAEMLRDVERLVVTTGAGMSSESGVPTFRDAPNALWRNYNPEDLATRDGFRRNPSLVWRWYAERREMIARAAPHGGHRALARMASMFETFLLVTQNIDNLHTRAGSTDVVELHGNIFRFKCFDRDHPASPTPQSGDEPPRCACGSYLRPDVVWFGEALDPSNLDRAFDAAHSCDAMLVVGTSGLVYPAAGLPGEARSAGARIIEVNPERTPVSEIADVFIRTPAAKALLCLVDARGGATPGRQTH
jgi:NAD-dependent protein deacetylase/lipoamidase